MQQPAILSVILSILTAMLTSGVVSAIIGFLINSKNVKLQYITQERSKWRSDIRKKATRIMETLYSTEIRPEEKTKTFLKIKYQLSLKLNPYDKADQSILTAIEQLAKGQNEERAKSVMYCLSCLLKDDWERSKNEVRIWPFSLLFRRRKRPVIEN
ncbi:MAG TPA: hypothetical protein DD738_05855 [Ruminiclostridium sp.]|mgnify:FL=1|jgi:hypothetical protein|nr:hypothetical protein [Ruminiclostridium sp.]